MWIRLKDQDTLINIVKFKAVEGFKIGEKGLIYGHYASRTLFHANMQVIAKYKTFDEAKQSIKRIENAINNNSNQVYQID